ncbi:MAG: SusD/RagB family nutrient-binding outer membrane lipoprotein, partial [Segetibacter sp.]|nr:SusD/RagB family nutrient-binding outer membrane lipoprotein [Segetibacter sp.]
MKKITLISLAFVLILGSCKKITDGVNVDPNRPTDVGTRYDLLINGAELSTILLFEGQLARLGGLFSRTFTGVDRQYVSEYNYEITAGDFDDGWDRLYAVIVANTKLTIDKATVLNDKTSAGIAQVLQAMAFGLAADLWGDVPFSEAGNPAMFPTPKFDAQATVYAGVQTLLSTAITNLQANVGAGPGAKDFFYQGDRAKWMAAAYTLKARYILHTK